MISAMPMSSPGVAVLMRITFLAMAMIATRMMISTWNSLLSRYDFIVSRSSEDLARILSNDIENMVKDGRMEKIVGRYL